jgi:GTP cyclohydrolase II
MTASRALTGSVLHLGTRTLATRHGEFLVHVCHDLTRRTHLLAIACGDFRSSEPLLARVHSSCVTSETYGGCDCDCSEQLDAALAAIAAAGRGVVFYLDQEGRGAGFVAKVRDRMLVQASGGRLGTFEAYAQLGLPADLRTYDAIAGARAVLGIVAPLVLLTNNPDKLAALLTLGIPLAGSAGLARPSSPFNQHYLAAKAAAGHRLSIAPGAVEAHPPEPVEVVAPRALAEAPHLVCMGSYWLPVRAKDDPDAATHWFRLSAYVDLVRGHDRVVLAYGATEATPVLLRFQRESLLERIPGRRLGEEQGRWAATIRAFAEHGAGCAVMLADESSATLAGAAPVTHDDGTVCLALARHHLGSRVAMPLLDPAERDGGVWQRRLADAGVQVASPRVLAAA